MLIHKLNDIVLKAIIKLS